MRTCCLIGDSLFERACYDRFKIYFLMYDEHFLCSVLLKTAWMFEMQMEEFACLSIAWFSLSKISYRNGVMKSGSGGHHGQWRSCDTCGLYISAQMHCFFETISERDVERMQRHIRGRLLVRWVLIKNFFQMSSSRP